MNYSTFRNFLWFLMLGTISLFTACVDQEFDIPPPPTVGEAFQNTISIAELKDYHEIGRRPTRIEDTVAIAGIVVADDQSGNFFKKLVVQDSTGGIDVQINVIGLYNQYPVGRQVFINCTGLFIGDFAGTMQLGGSYDAEEDRINRIDEVLLDQYIAQGVLGEAPAPKKVTIDQLGPENINTLIQLEGVQFASTDDGQTYADFANRSNVSAVNLILEDCNGQNVTLRNSSYSEFADFLTPIGNGTITAIYSVFGTTNQLFIRDVTDVNLESERCDGTGGGNVGQPFPNIVTIDDLKKTYYRDGDGVEITDSVSLKAVVVADDESGNFFKKLIIQDETGGIEIQINAFDLFETYPVGTEVYVNCMGLYIGDFAGTIQLGGSYNASEDQITRLAEGLVARFIRRGPAVGAPTPNLRTIAELGDTDQNTLIRLEGVQFISSDAGDTYADFDNRQNVSAVNLTLESCDGERITIRNSSFASFASDRTPDGNGAITAIYSVFNDTKQVFIRDTEDVDFNSSRCNGGGGGNGNETLLSIGEVRDLFQGTTTSAPSDSKIQGIVISDRINANITNRNLVIQGNDRRGIVVRYQDTHEFNLGDELEIIISDQEISTFDGLLQLNNLSLGSTTVLSQNNDVSPNLLTIREIIDDFEDYESTLVKIENVTISKDGGNDFVFNTILDDQTSTITMFTTSYSNFANNRFPTNTVEITAIVAQGGDDQVQQVSIRNLNDIVGGDTGGGGDDPKLELDFEDQTSGEDLAIAGWQNISLKGTGTRKWRAGDFSGNTFAQATAFSDDNPEVDTWLISPELDLTDISTLQFESAQAFWVHDGLTILFSTDYDGSNVESATWQELDVTLAAESDARYAWVDSGIVSLEDFNGTGYLAFRYVGTSNANTTTYRLDNIKLR